MTVLVSTAGASTAAVATASSPSTSAASVAAPDWWNGDCDAGHWNAAAAAKGWTGVGAHRLGASYLGVPVCGPRHNDGGPDILWTRSAWGEYEWECPELAFRFMAQIYGVRAYGANGDDVVRNYRSSAGGGLEVVANGTRGRAPQPGDVMSFDLAGGLGHVAVVESTAVDQNGDGTIRLITQNDTADGWRVLRVTGWVVQPFGNFVPYGWLHDPAGRGGGGGGQTGPTLAAGYVSQGAYTDATKSTPVDLTHSYPGETMWFAVTVRNVGSETWSGPVDLGTDHPRDRSSMLANGYWLSAHRPARMQETAVPSGATATFEFPVVVSARAVPGQGWDDSFTPVWEGRSWLNDLGIHFTIKVEKAPFAPFPSADAFVAQQGADFLATSGSVASRAADARALEVRQVSPSQAIDRYLSSPAFAEPGATLVRLYSAYFHRAPDMPGFLYWLGRARAGTPLADISKSFAASGAFVAAHNGQTNSAFVQFAYLSVLGRPSDAAGQAHWTSSLNGGTSRAAVMVSLSESAEHRKAMDNQTSIGLAYLGMLRRPPDSSGSKVWLGMLGSGRPVTDLLQAIVTSSEYAGRFH
ncbi:MAG: DUF4214 domain-containing protein [Actinomycetota bacterium]|nr:DUF4214 domain-containing protein [Actinomycetota bacterium]